MIVADTSAIVALVDRDDRHHEALRELFEREADYWVLPWAVLPEIDYMLATHVGTPAAEAFLEDVTSGVYSVEWGDPRDLKRSRELRRRHRALKLGLVDSVVMAVAERLKARAVATLDLRHFGAVELSGRPHLFPRDRPS